MSPIYESILEIDERHWLIGNALLLTREKVGGPPDNASWSDGEGGYFTLGDAPMPLPPTEPGFMWADLSLTSGEPAKLLSK
jgi:hypothetical protein